MNLEDGLPNYLVDYASKYNKNINLEDNQSFKASPAYVDRDKARNIDEN